MIKLYQFPISHYCEKARWALDHMEFDYQTINLVPGLHLKTIKKLAVKSSVPIIQYQQKVIEGSNNILDFLETLSPERSLLFEDAGLNQQVFDWEKRLDKVAGVNVRLVAYHLLLEHPKIVKPFFAHQGPWYAALFLLLAYPKLAKTMRRHMGINETSFVKAKQELHQLLDELQNCYQQKTFLIGDRFSRADLTAASLFAPLVMPAGYGLIWPKDLPSDYASLGSEYAEKLTWVKTLYKSYR